MRLTDYFEGNVHRDFLIGRIFVGLNGYKPDETKEHIARLIDGYGADSIATQALVRMLQNNLSDDAEKRFHLGMFIASEIQKKIDVLNSDLEEELQIPFFLLTNALLVQSAALKGYTKAHGYEAAQKLVQDAVLKPGHENPKREAFRILGQLSPA